MNPEDYPMLAPECWWSQDGIDALCFGDGIPYEFDGDQ
jgi:hypothetical protein